MFPVSKVCRILKINRNKYYYIKKIKNNVKKVTEIEKVVLEIYNRHIGNYGRRRIKREINITVSEHTISRILKKYGLTPKAGRHKVGKNIYTAPGYIFDNKIKKLGLPVKTNTIWCADMSEFKYRNGKLQASGIIDITSKVVILETGNSPNAEFAIQNLEKALKKMGKPQYYHTDRGSAYTSAKMKDMLNEMHIEHSMSAPHTPNDNQYIETFWKSMKTEIGNTKNMTEEQLTQVIKYYEYYYNCERLHSSIGYAYPMEYFKNKQLCH